MIPHSGVLLKMADGLVVSGWHPRYFVIRGSTLQYFTNARDARPKEIIDLNGAIVSWIGDHADQSNCIHVIPAVHRPLHVASASLEESRQWLRWLQEAADPQAYMDVALAKEASMTLPQDPPRSSVPSCPGLDIPKDISHKFIEAAHAMQQAVAAVDSGSVSSDLGLSLVDVRSGVSTYSPIKNAKLIGPLVLALVGFLLMAAALLLRDTTVTVLVTALALVYGYRTNREMSQSGHKRKSSSKAAHSFTISTVSIPSLVPLGGLNWLLDGTRMGMWIPGSVSTFTNRNPSSSSDELVVVTPVSVFVADRVWWDVDGAVVCVLAVSSPGVYHGWCIRRTETGSLVIYIQNGKFGSGNILTGFSAIVALYGNHEGEGVPRLVSGEWKRGLAGVLERDKKGKKNHESLLLPILKGITRLSLSSRDIGFSGSVSPLAGISSLFGSVGHVSAPGPLTSLLIFEAILNAMVPAAKLLGGSVQWTKQHPIAGSTQLCWVGPAQAHWEVSDSSRKNTGLWAISNVGISGPRWSIRGKDFKYAIFGGDRVMKIAFSGCLEIREEEKIWKISLPSLLVGFNGSVVWEGLLRVSTESDSVVGKIMNGSIIGSVMNGSGQKTGNIHGHWLEHLYVDTTLLWTAGLVESNVVTMTPPGESEVAPPLTISHPPVPRMSSADEAAFEVIEVLRAQIPQLAQPRFSDQYLYRFARARHFKIEDTKKMVLAHIEWLEEHQVDSLMSSFEYPELPQVKAAFPHGYHGVDKHGRPIYISRLAKTNQDAMFQVTTWERFIKFWIHSYEDLIWKKIPACEAKGGKNPVNPNLPVPSSLCALQTLTILDVKGIGISQLSSKVREFISITSKLASDNYPEILGTMYIVNSPSMFPAIWGGIKSMIDPGTREKIHVVKSSQTKDKLLEIISPYQLPFFLGGDCKCAEGTVGDDTDFGCLSSDKGPWNM
jgi:hypothetical protein